MKLNTTLTLAALTGLALSANASAAVLLSESFSGTLATDLVGTTTTDGNDWTGSGTFQADGTTGGSNYKTAYLAMPSAVVAGEIYTLTATFGGPGWAIAKNAEPVRVGLAVGNLDQNGDATGGGQRPDVGAFDVMAWSNGRGRMYPESSGSESGFGDGTTVGQTITMVLDTQTNPLDYQLSYWTGGTQIGSTFNVGVQAFDHLWIGHERPTTNNDDIHFDQITLSDTSIPEPSSVALLGLGGLALLRRRRK